MPLPSLEHASVAVWRAGEDTQLGHFVVVVVYSFNRWFARKVVAPAEVRKYVDMDKDGTANSSLHTD